MKKVKNWAWATALVALAGTAQATLISQGDGTVKDTNTNLLWEQNANHGPFNWADANTYANTLNLNGTGWHLATFGELLGLYNDLIAAAVCTGANCTGSIGGFTGIQRDYWSSTESAPGIEAVTFRFGDGPQLGGRFENFAFAAWAVRPGDVTAAVPEPQTLALALLALCAAVMAGRRRAA